jgi:hypothetical protein
MQLTVPVLVHPTASEAGGIAAGDRSRQAARIISPLPPTLRKRRLRPARHGKAQLDGRPRCADMDGDDVGELTGKPESDAATACGVGAVVAGGREHRRRAEVVDPYPGHSTVWKCLDPDRWCTVLQGVGDGLPHRDHDVVGVAPAVAVPARPTAGEA